MPVGLNLNQISWDFKHDEKTNRLIPAYIHIEKYEVLFSVSMKTSNGYFLHEDWYRNKQVKIIWRMMLNFKVTNLLLPIMKLCGMKDLDHLKAFKKKKSSSFLPVLMEHLHPPTPIVTVSLSFLKSPGLLNCAMNMWMSTSNW